MQEKTLSVLEQLGGKSLNTRGFKSIKIFHIENARAAWVRVSPSVPPELPPALGVWQVAPPETPSPGDPAPRPAAGMPRGWGAPGGEESGRVGEGCRRGKCWGNRQQARRIRSLCFTRSSSKPKDIFFFSFFFFFMKQLR